MDVDEFAEAVAADHGRLTRIVFLVCGDRSIAEDCAQEALLKAWVRVRDGEPLESIQAWTTTVALNACRSRLRRLGAERRALDRMPPPREGIDDVSSALGDDVAAAVLALPVRQREVVVLHYFADYEVATTASLLGISVGAVKNALFHARAALAVALGAPDPVSTEPEGRP